MLIKILEEMQKMTENLEGKISYDLWDAYRKFSNHDIFLIAKVLHESGPLPLRELRERTHIDNANILNHDLLEMRRVWIVKKIDKKYYLTKYGTILYDSIAEIKRDLSLNSDIFAVSDKKSTTHNQLK
jgi:hypothetical protein